MFYPVSQNKLHSTESRRANWTNQRICQSTHSWCDWATTFTIFANLREPNSSRNGKKNRRFQLRWHLHNLQSQLKSPKKKRRLQKQDLMHHPMKRRTRKCRTLQQNQRRSLSKNNQSSNMRQRLESVRVTETSSIRQAPSHWHHL